MTEQSDERIGARLRTAREQSGKSLQQIADVTKLTVRTLSALEAERIDQLPGGIYRRAIVRAYARETGLNPEVVVRAFLEQHPDDLPALPPLGTRKQATCEVVPDSPSKRESPRMIHAIMSAVGAVLPGAVSYLRGNRSPHSSS